MKTAANTLLSSSVSRLLSVLTLFPMLALLMPQMAGAQSNNVNLYTGDSSYTVPIVTPPGTNGMGPSLALTYSSGGKGDDFLGDGWSLQGLGSVERLGPNYSLAPTYTASDTYRLSFPGGGGKLVCEKDAAGNCTSIYHTEIESFLRIEFVSASNYWVVTDKGGVKYYFGAGADQGNFQQYNPGNAAQVFAWRLGFVANYSVFWSVSYNTDVVGGGVYPKQIVYSREGRLTCTPANLATCRVVDFFYEARPDVATSYRTGGKVVSDQRLQRIEVKLGGQLNKRYLLGHIMSAPTARGFAPISQLSSITESGADGITSLPPTTFTYNVATSANGASLALASPSVVPSPAEGLGGCTVAIDMNNDRLPDILVGQGGNYYYYPNLGANNFGAAPINIANPNPANPLPTLCNTSTTYRRSSVREGFLGLSGSRKVTESTQPVHDTTVMDIDGDGLPDIVSTSSGPWYWWRNKTGDGDGACVPAGSTCFADRALITGLPMGLTDVNLRLGDMNGDGLVDVVYIQPVDISDNAARVTADVYNYRNQGRDLSGTINFVLSSTIRVGFGFTSSGGKLCNTDRSCYSTSGIGQLFPSSVSLADMNGDGLPDLVWIAIDGPPDNYTTTNRVYYYPNMGGNNFGPRAQIVKAGGAALQIMGKYHFSYDSSAPGSPVYEYYSYYSTALNLNEFHRLVDMNGDGLTDLLTANVGTGLSTHGVGYPHQCAYYPLQANGTFGELVNLQGCDFGGLTRSANTALTDMNGDGFPDILKGNPGNYVSYYLNHSDSHQFLLSARNPLGGAQSFYYQRLRSGNTIRWVTNMTIGDYGLGTDLYPFTYAYSGGNYVGWPQNEFRGYNSVVVTDPADFATKNYFYQDDARKGRLDKIEMLSSSSPLLASLFMRTANTYTTSTPITGVTRVDLAAQQVDTYDGGASFKSARTDYGLFDAYGNARQVTSSGTDVTPRVTTTDFVYNTSAYIVNRPSRTETRLTSATGTKISETWFDYEGKANGAAPQFFGNLTRETHLLSGGVNPVLQYAYDAVGNRIGVLDTIGNTCTATGYTSSTVYDTTYQTFPVSETNALCQVTSKTYWGINTSLAAIPGAFAFPGQLATVTDSNGVRGESYWDPVGRPKASVMPPDTATSPTTTWAYGLTGTAPSFTTESKRESAGGGTLDKVTHVDGFGRTIQVKSEAEAAGQWITQDTFYNNRGLTESVNVPYLTAAANFSALNTTQPKSTTLYDAVGRSIKVTNPDDTFRTNVYTPFVVASTDEKGFTTTRTYDAMQRLISVVEPAGGGATSYGYDSFDTAGNNTQQITDAAGNVSGSVFDTLGRKVALNDPDLGYWSYIFDANGNVRSQTDNKLQTQIYTYDKLNRISTRSTGGGNIPPPAPVPALPPGPVPSPRPVPIPSTPVSLPAPTLPPNPVLSPQPAQIGAVMMIIMNLLLDE